MQAGDGAQWCPRRTRSSAGNEEEFGGQRDWRDIITMEKGRANLCEQYIKMGSPEGPLECAPETVCAVVPESVGGGMFSCPADCSGLRSGQRGSEELLIQGEGFASRCD